MKLESFFDLARENGIEQSQIYVSKSSSFRIRLFHHEIETYNVSSTQGITAAGIVNGKFVTASTPKIDKDTFQYLIDQLKLSAKFTEKPAEVDLFPGSSKYKKGSTYNPKLGKIPAKEKLDLLMKLEQAIYDADPRVTDTDMVTYSESEYETIFMNSYGLKLRGKGNHFAIVSGVVVKQGEETKTFYDGFVDNDLSKFDAKKFVNRLVERAVSKFGGSPCKAGLYPTVLHREIASTFLSVLIRAASAESVQRHSSFLEGRLNQKIASKKLTVVDKPLYRDLNYTYFDDEAVTTRNQTIIKDGVLLTYLHNRSTAKKAGVEPTGNGRLAGRRMDVGFYNLFVKPGKQNFNEMISSITDGVYITEIAGLGTGLNDHSGDFSCQAEGYRIRDGKLAEPLNLITLSGNVLKMFEDLRCFDNDADDDNSGIICGNAFIKKMNIGGDN